MLKNDMSAIDTIGKRIKYLLELANLSPDIFATNAALSRTVVYYWLRSDEHISLTTKSVNKILETIENAGIECTAQWLLTGTGSLPKKANALFSKKDLSINSADELAIGSDLANHTTNLEYEINIFTSLYKHAVTTRIDNTCLLPIFRKGDIVGGLWQPLINLREDDICIVNVGGKLQVRKVKKGTSNQLFDLSYVSYDANYSDPFELKDIVLDKIAPIIRVWR